jgi:phosphoribosyl-ATP pyrophosphohydrolase
VRRLGSDPQGLTPRGVEFSDVEAKGLAPPCEPMASDVLERLAATIQARRESHAASSYTKALLDAGTERCARKLGEEAVETVIAALRSDASAVTREAADLVYHLLVLLESRQIAWADVLAELETRMGTSGLAEKAARTRPAP